VARLLASHRSFEEAQKQLDAYRKEFPEDTALNLGTASFYEVNGQADEAAKIYRCRYRSSRQDPIRLTARIRLASLHLRRAKWNPPRRSSTRCSRRIPPRRMPLVIGAEMALRRGDPPAAVQSLRVAFSQPARFGPARRGPGQGAHAGGARPAGGTGTSVGRTAKPADVQARFALGGLPVETGKAQQGDQCWSNWSRNSQ